MSKVFQVCRVWAVAAVLLLLASTATAESYDVYILTGQSNSLGTTRYDGDDPKDYGPGENRSDRRVDFFWSNVHASNTAYPPRLYGDSDGKIVPLTMQQGDGKHNPRFWGPEFGLARMLAGDTKKRLLIIKASRGGGGNSYWDKAVFNEDKDAGHMWKHLCDTVDAALKVMVNRGDNFDVRGLIYIQGESNSAEEASVAGTRLAALYNNLQAHINKLHDQTANSMKLVIVEIAASQNAEARRRTTLEQQSLADTDASCVFVNSNDLPLQPDRIHFGKKAKLTIGKRLASAIQEIEAADELDGCAVDQKH